MTTGHLHSSILEMNRFFTLAFWKWTGFSKEIEATRSCLFENVICSAAWDLVWQGTWALWRLTNCSPVICVHCSPNPPNRHQRSSPKGWQWQSLVSSSSISRCWCFGEWYKERGQKKNGIMWGKFPKGWGEGSDQNPLHIFLCFFFKFRGL